MYAMARAGSGKAAQPSLCLHEKICKKKGKTRKTAVLRINVYRLTRSGQTGKYLALRVMPCGPSAAKSVSCHHELNISRPAFPLRQ